MNSNWGGEGRRTSDRAERRGWKDVVIAILSSVLITSAVGWVSYVKDAPRSLDVRQLQAAVTDLAKTVSGLQTSVAVLADHVGVSNAVAAASGSRAQP